MPGRSSVDSIRSNGTPLQTAGKSSACRSVVSKAIVASPTEADGYIFLGSVHALMGNLGAALEQHQQGARCSSGCLDEAHYNVGLVLRAMSRYREAAEAFRKALKIDRGYVEAKRALRDVESALHGKAPAA
jgi:tetratricopeptide (TPR) repeat protein